MLCGWDPCTVQVKDSMVNVLRDRPRRTVHYVDVSPLVSDSDE